MEAEELRQSVLLFDTPDKWNAFLELSRQTDRLKRMMTRPAVERADRYFQLEHPKPKWSFRQFSPDEFSMVWYLTEYGEYSICLVFHWDGIFVLEARGGCNDVAKTTALLQEARFRILLECFERIDTWWDNHLLAKEKFNFSFGTSADGHYGPFRLAWHAHYNTESLINQLGRKLAPFQTPEMTQLLSELNALTKK
ncbi:hypothetical protein I2I05_19135 [Hymenobacter sp. BT683]|uniref:DUF4268 domain-containing protein n=1 Tax=Hymenobacter jeongseonensis TaxID=2791027 RepID=A0ABS0IMG2_9BACT|nr:hypothetical protein [Hymenobacter jeongseonensis]MBF9239516.1 hypothetical protein [Hymenobacter jeongseonensis]